MQTRRKSQAPQDAGIKSEAVTPKRATTKRRLLSSAVQQEEQAHASARPSQSPSRKRSVKVGHRERPTPSRRQKSGTQASRSTLGKKGVEESVPPLSTAQSEKDKIRINRAPVLTMWVAVVAMREGYTYEEGLSFGKAIAGLMAQSKGRSLGLYEAPSEEKKEERKRKRKELDRFHVFGMNVPGKTTQDGLRLALQSGKPILPASVANYLHRSFGDNQERAKGAMKDLANSFAPEEIGGSAYSLYEKFRPTVPHGVKGWGAKGLLDIESMCALRKH